MKVIPALVIVSGWTVRVVWNNPNTDDNWITLKTEDGVDRPNELAKEFALALRENAMAEGEVKGMEVANEEAPAENSQEE